jgi:REP element-mobilizing transposase RayT
MPSPRPHPLTFKRLKRWENPNQARALNFSCAGNQTLLSSTLVRGWFSIAMERALYLHPVHLWAYCLMPTHVHLLVYPLGAEPNVGRFLDAVKRSTSQQALTYHRRAGRQDPVRLWQPGGGYDRNLVTVDSIWAMIDYIHMNPVEAGLCKHPADWPDSSARRYERNEPTGITLNLTHVPPRQSA